MSLQHFLENKPLYYNEIDYTRMPRVYEKIKSHFIPTKIIHLIGTNGKGTTGRFLAAALHNKGFNVGHYTSPHILEFNERIWLDGTNISNELLDMFHDQLQEILDEEDIRSLSYFEYTTLLAMLSFNGCDYVVLEAGLGGEHDATAVFPKLLTLVTPIDFDHEAFLGSSIEAIARTKLNAIQNKAIITKQKYSEVYDVLEEIKAKKGIEYFNPEAYLNREDLEKIEKISKTLSLVDYLEENLKLSISALKQLGLEFEADDFKNARLFGRLSRFKDNIYIDVGHNPLAAASILQAFKGRKLHLIYNSFHDKDYVKILKILKPIIKRVEILEVDDERIEKGEKLQKVLTDLEIESFPHEKIDEDKEYLVFGSFSVVENFLKVYNG